MPSPNLATNSGPEVPDGWKDLPLDLLGKIASGRDDLKAMRGVCTQWKTGFDSSVTKIHMGEGRLGGQTDVEHLAGVCMADRFPRLNRFVACLIFECNEQFPHHMSPVAALEDVI